MTFAFLLFKIACVQNLAPVQMEKEAVKAGSGKIGVRYQRIEEGILVLSVVAGMGADTAGLQRGDLVVSVDGQDVFDGQRNRIAGPSGEAVRLGIRGPLGEEERAVDVMRGELLRSAGEPSNVSEEQAALRSSMRRGEIAEVRKALVEADGVPPSALASSLRLASRERPRDMPQLLPLFSSLEISSPGYWYSLSQVEAKHLGPEVALVSYRKYQSLLPPDYRSASGEAGELGGSYPERLFGAGLLVRSGARTEATDLARLLALSRPIQKLSKDLQLAPYPKPRPWRVTLSPVSDFTTELLDGTPWTLSEHAGEVVVLNFWATWCGPCRKELPELQKLADSMSGSPVAFIAVNTEEPELEAKVQGMAEKLGLSIPVAQDRRLAAAFEVSSLPALRVLGPTGRPQYSAKGYSSRAMKKLEEQIAQAMEGEGEGSLLGADYAAGGASPATLLHFSPMRGMAGILPTPEGLLVGDEYGAPVLYDGLPAQFEEDHEAGQLLRSDGLLAWAPGSVFAGRRAGLLLRSFDEYGGENWMRTFPSPLLDIQAVADGVWVATSEELFLLSLEGTMLDRLDVSIQDLQVVGGALFALTTGESLELAREGNSIDISARKELAGAGCMDPAGGVGTPEFRQLAVGRWGPAGEQRVVAVRRDGAIVAMGGDGRPAWTLFTETPVQIAAWDSDGDGHDELLAAFSRQGLAKIGLQLP
jgi:thiol-disulfide isomerase/thioredoxin